MSAGRKPRADSVRNRARILQAAAEEFAEIGVDASIASIADRAGVGKGTVFRHFATKDDLLEAIAIHRFERLAEVGERLAGSTEPGRALRDFLFTVGREQQQVHLTFVQNIEAVSAEAYGAYEKVHDAVGLLVRRAQEHGEVREDITATDVMLLMCAPRNITAHLHGVDPEIWKRYLAIIFDGFRPDTTEPLLRPAPEEIRRS